MIMVGFPSKVIYLKLCGVPHRVIVCLVPNWLPSFKHVISNHFFSLWHSMHGGKPITLHFLWLCVIPFFSNFDKTIMNVKSSPIVANPNLMGTTQCRCSLRMIYEIVTPRWIGPHGLRMAHKFIPPLTFSFSMPSHNHHTPTLPMSYSLSCRSMHPLFYYSILCL